MAIALVNDYELVLRGIAEMLRPYSDRIDVVEFDVAHNPDHRVDLALFDLYGNAQLGLDRASSLTRDPRVGSVAIYTWTLTAGQRDAAIAAGARGVIARPTAPDELVEPHHRTAIRPRPIRAAHVEELGEHLSLTRERIRQIEARAITKMRDRVGPDTRDLLVV